MNRQGYPSSYLRRQSSNDRVTTNQSARLVTCDVTCAWANQLSWQLSRDPSASRDASVFHVDPPVDSISDILAYHSKALDALEVCVDKQIKRPDLILFCSNILLVLTAGIEI